MDPTGDGRRLGAGALLGITGPIIVSVVSDGLDLFEPHGLGTALVVAILALVGVLVSQHRLFWVGALFGAAAYYPVALAWAINDGLSLGG